MITYYKKILKTLYCDIYQIAHILSCHLLMSPSKDNFTK